MLSFVLNIIGMKKLLSLLLLVFISTISFAQPANPRQMRGTYKFNDSVDFAAPVFIQSLSGTGTILKLDTVSGLVSRFSSDSLINTLQQVTASGSTTTDSITTDGIITPYARATLATGIEMRNNSGTAAAVFGQSGGLNSQFNGNISLSNNLIKSVAAGVDSTDAVILQQLQDSAFAIAKRRQDSLTGWSVYNDDEYTFLNKLVITAGDTVTLPNNAAAKIQSQIPLGVDSFYNSFDTVVIGNNVGDVLDLTINFQTSNSNGNGYFTLIIDIGGGVSIIPITAKTFDYPKGAGIPHPYSTSNFIYSLSTFVANGAKVKIVSEVGDTSIWNISYFVTRIHRGK